MRFLRKDLKKVYVFCAKEEESDYVGTTVSYEPSHVIYCHIAPAADKHTSEAFGERAYNMVNLMCTKNYDIKDGYRISLKGFEMPEYKVISVMEYTHHKVITVEVIKGGIGS